MQASRRVGALLLGAALVSACGSTVQSSRTVTDGEHGLAPGITPDGLPGSDSGAGLPAGDGSRTTTPGGGGPGRGTVPTPAALPAPTGAAGARLGPGVDAASIQIGLSIQENNATVSSLAATYNVTLPNSRGAYEAFVAYVNAHGGVAGRKLRPVYYTYDPSSADADQIDQAACARFTEDAEVFAALDVWRGGVFNACMQRRGRLILPYGLFVGSRKTWQSHPNVVAADGLPMDDGARILAENLASTGFLSRSTRLGAVVRSSADMTEAYRRGFVPALEKLGLGVAQAQFIRDPQGASEISGYTSDISSAVLKFRSSGIDRVVFLDTGSYSALVFTQTAEKQGYRPRYGFTSLNGLASLQGEGSTVPREQLAGAQGVSWETIVDGLTKSRTRSARLCAAILREAGIVATDSGTEAAYLESCQTFLLFKAVADRAGNTLNRDSFVGAAERLGTGFESTNTWGGLTRFGAGDHSGVSVYRPFVYDSDCSCFRVTGGPRSVGDS